MSHRSMTFFATAAVLLRLIFPAGYMPGDATQGGLINICHQGLPLGILDTSTHHHQDHSDHLEIDSSNFCPLGFGLDSSLFFEFEYVLNELAEPDHILSLYRAQVSSSRYPRSQLPRAPPFSLS